MLPSVEAFLRLLPDAERSYPEYVVKASVVRGWIEGEDPDRLAAVVPAVVQPLVAAEVPVSAWVSEVHATIIYLSVRDVFYTDDDAFVEAALRKNTVLLSGVLYRALLKLLSPRHIGRLGQSAFNQLHRGIDMAVEAEKMPWIFTLTYAPHLVPELIARCYATAAQAVLTLNGMQNVRVHATDVGRTRARLEIRF